MENNRKFDSDYLKDIIKRASQKLEDKTISKEQKVRIKELIREYSILLNTIDSSWRIPKKENPKNNVFSKKRLLTKMQEDSEMIKENFMNSIIVLNNYKDFKTISVSSYYQRQSTEQIIENSLDVYKSFAPELLPYALQIVNHPKQLINFSSKRTGCSRCIFNYVENLPFLEIERIYNSPSSFIHELQHGVEFMKGYPLSQFYNEIGSILFELFYIDAMVQRNEKNAELLYFRWYNFAVKRLRFLSNYFYTLLELKQYDFKISTRQMVNILKEERLILNERGLLKMFQYDVVQAMTYLLSFLKSLKIRELFYTNPKNGWEEFDRMLTNRKSIVPGDVWPVLESFNNYEKEILDKQKTKYRIN